jgi:hypothetical protein
MSEPRRTITEIAADLKAAFAEQRALRDKWIAVDNARVAIEHDREVMAKRLEALRAGGTLPGSNRMSELLPCARCGEGAFVVSCDGKHLVRLNRWSKCKNYRPPRLQRGNGSESCQTELHDTAESAIAEWNARFGTPTPEAASDN